MTYTVLDDKFYELIFRDESIEKIDGGSVFTEGPIWHPVGHYLLFSDIPSDARKCWDEQHGVTLIRHPANKCNGMTYDSNLNLIVCEHVTSSVVRETADGKREILASHFEGLELNSPNDVCVHSSGAIYFSDPWYGRMPVFGVERPRELNFQGVYRIDPKSGETQLVVDRLQFSQPNGLCFSPDETLLYINDTVQSVIYVYDVNTDGYLINCRVFAKGISSGTEEGNPDGMKCDNQGNIWVTGPAGVWVYSAEGDLLGKIHVPEKMANLAWGGPNFDQLFLTATKSLYRLKTRVSGRREPFMKKVLA